MRICKGTARLVSADSQNSPDSEPDTYRIASPQSSPNKLDIDRKCFSPEVTLKQEIKMSSGGGTSRGSHYLHQQPQPMVTTVSIPLDNSDMRRTTRSRAKNLQLDLAPVSSLVSSPPPTTPNSHSSGLSLTLRKSVTDSNNTLISHYDIVKTDCNTSYASKPTIEPLIGRDQPLPTTTQELIDILSSDADNIMRSEAAAAAASAQALDESSDGRDDDGVQHCSIDFAMSDGASEADPEPEPEPETETEVEPESEILEEEEIETQDFETPSAPAIVADAFESAAAKTLVDQDWYSGSEDSEGASGHADNEMPMNPPSPTMELLQPSVPSPMNLAAKPATKKGSIFKSRSTGATNGNKRRALYKHKWCDSDKESNTPESTSASDGLESNVASGSHGNAGAVAFEEEFEVAPLTRVVTYPEVDMDFTDETEAITSIRCGKKVKGVSINCRIHGP